MLFYAAIFISSLIVATVVIWLWRAIFNAGKVVYQTILPSYKDSRDPTSHLDTHRLVTTIHEVQTPWGWKGGANPAQLARSTTPAPARPAAWGWPGNQLKTSKNKSNHVGHKTYTVQASGMRNSTKEKPHIGWPYRAELISSSGKTYSGNRIEKLRKNHLKTMNKPWGW